MIDTLKKQNKLLNKAYSANWICLLFMRKCLKPEKTLNRYIEKSVVLSNYSVGDNLLKPYQCNVYKA